MQLPARKTWDIFAWKKRDVRVIDIILHDRHTGQDLVKVSCCHTGPHQMQVVDYQLQKRVKEAIRDWYGPEGLL